jgi:hypothetical protein
MKKIILLAGFLAFAALTQAQDNTNTNTNSRTTTKTNVIQSSDVPTVVVTKFQTSYPSVSSVNWNRMGSDYMAVYNENNGEYYVLYTPTGDVMETGQSVDVSTVPSSLNTYVKTKYKDDKMVKYYKVKDAKGKTVWKGKVEQGYLLFDENGNYIKMEKD